jgi:peptide methionine sulfoxide reductase MsrA
MTKYNLWLAIEKESGDEGEEEYEDVGTPYKLGVYETEEEARKVAEYLNNEVIL